MIRVIIADDSVFMRRVLSDLFNKQPDFTVVATAANGKEAIDKTKELKPDLLTLDVNMPVMDGLNALAVIMEQCPTPTLMVSSLTQRGTDATIRALALGAVDFISKDGGAISRIDHIADEILEKSRNVAQAKVRRFLPSMAHASPSSRENGNAPPKVARPALSRFAVVPTGDKAVPGNVRVNPAATAKAQPTGKKLVVIGTSTGGPQALQAVITRLPGNLPCGVTVVQHMPAGFTKSLADRLDTISAVSVKEAENDDVIEPGHVYIAPGNYHLKIKPDGNKRKIVLTQEPPVGNHRPAVNVMFDSAAQFGSDIVSVIMTGMGCDGCDGMKKIKQHGGYSIAQNEATSIVYGMPKAVVDAGLADEVKPLQEIANAIVAAVRK